MFGFNKCFYGESVCEYFPLEPQPFSLPSPIPQWPQGGTWSSESNHEGHVYIWKPVAPIGYKSVGFVVTTDRREPELDEVRCVRVDLTENFEVFEMILDTNSTFSNYPIRVWNTRSCERGMLCTGVSVGTFFCSTYLNSEDDMEITCLKNLDSSLHAMPNPDQLHALIKHYGPTVFFHPNEDHLPHQSHGFSKMEHFFIVKEKIRWKPLILEARTCRVVDLMMGSIG